MAKGKRNRDKSKRNNRAIHEKIRVIALNILNGAVIFGARAINGIDNGLDRLARQKVILMYHITHSIHHFRYWIEEHERSIVKHLAGLALIATALIGTINYFSCYEYSYNGREIGYVKTQDDVIRILNIANKALSQEHNSKVNLQADSIQFHKVPKIGKALDSEDQVLKKFTYMSDIKAKGYAIVVEGQNDSEQVVALLPTKAAAKEVLDEVKAHYLTEKEKSYKSISFKEKVKIREEDTTLTAIDSRIAAEKRLTDPAHPLLTVITSGEETNVISIPYETIEEKTGDLYSGEQQILQEGSDGRKVVTADVTRENGVKVAEKEKETQVLVEPTKKIVRIGIAERPKTAATGTFKYPLSRYRISSEFGYRWGRLHEGLDLSAPTGTPIMAADGGKVIRASDYGAYGLCIDIDHENGKVTRYAHCSAIDVSVGDRVYQGQVIGAVGNTGRSYGAHCHFEIRVNGTAVDPAGYL